MKDSPWRLTQTDIIFSQISILSWHISYVVVSSAALPADCKVKDMYDITVVSTMVMSLNVMN